nr:hypothetical protein BaRGS_006048 [Batillaria attramentaria]
MDYDLDYQACLAQPWVYKAVLASATVLISICVVAVLLRLRKRIHRAFQNVFWRQIYRDLLDFHHGRNRKPPLQAQENTQYDLYVSYASEDEDWVLAHLIPELEGRLGKKLCIHERDFVPGKNIIGNIVDCMETSKRLMMLFSTAFAHSDWCQYELTLALNYAMERDESLVVAILDEIDPKDLSPAMKAVLSTFTYVEWQREPFLQAGPGFWDRLETAMQEAETVL